jgi:hypothetical protein
MINLLLQHFRFYLEGRKRDRLVFTWTGGTEKVEIGAALKCNGDVR